MTEVRDSELPLVTIRMAAYNHENYVEAALDSALAADYPNKELVIVNDGSTDRTPDIISGWITQHESEIPVTYVSRENRGLPATLNELYALSRGEFLVPLASDDLLHPNGIRPRVAYLLDHPKKMAVVGDAMMIDGEGAVTMKSVLTEVMRIDFDDYATDAGIRRHVIRVAAPPGPCMAARRELYSIIGLADEKMRVIDDWDMYLRMVATDLLGFINVTVGIYRRHGKNMSRDKHSAGLIKLDMIRTIRRNFLRFHGAERRMLLGRLYPLISSYARHDLPGRLFRGKADG